MVLHPDGTISWTPNPLQVDTVKYAIVASHGVATDSQFVSLFVNHPPVIKNAPTMMNTISVGGIWDFELDVYDLIKNDPLIFSLLINYHLVCEWTHILDFYVGSLQLMN